MSKRYDQQTPLTGNLTGTDMLCFSRAPYGDGAPFVKAYLTDVFSYVNSLLSPLFFAGTWNAATNTPSLVSGSGVNGAVYVVNTAGTTDLNGHNDWKVGDWAVFDENIMEWTQVANEVISTINIYNTDGSLTGDRTLALNGHTLKFGSDPSAQIILNGSQEIYVSAGSSVNLDAPAINIGSISHQLNILTNTTKFWGAAFQGSQQYLTVNSLGVVVPTSPPTDTNIYNSDGTLTGNRTVALGSSSLFFVGSTGSTLQFSAPDITVNGAQATVSSSNITFDAAQFVGAGTQWLTTDNAGNIVPAAAPANIYNSNGLLTGNRIVTMGSSSLTFNGTSNFSIETGTIDLGLTSSTQLQLRATTFINQTGFIGGGNQYIGVNNSGQIIILPTPADTNIYNTDGTLTGNRTINFGTFTLAIGSGSTNAQFNELTQVLSLNAQTLNLTTKSKIFPSGSFGISNDPAGPINSILIGAISNTSQFYSLNSNLSSNINSTFENISNVDAATVTYARALGTSAATRALVNPTTLLGSIEFCGYDGAKYLTGGAIRVRAITSGLNVLVASMAFNIDTLLFQSNFAQLQGAYQFTSLPFTGGGTQFLTVDNSGNLGVSAGGGGTNIYNSNGSLTGNRVVTLGSNTLSFSGVGGFSVGSGCTATGSTSFSQGNTNIVSSTQSAAVGGLLNTINGLSSGVFVSNGCTINAGAGTPGYGLMIGAYNCTGNDNINATFFSTNSVNNGARSGIFGGITNKINAPNTLASADNFIFGGNTNTITGNVTYTTIGQSNGCIVGNNSTATPNTWIFNSGSSTVTSTGFNSNMVDLNGSNNTLSANYAFLINSKTCNLSNSTFGLGGRLFLANAVGFAAPGGFYSGALNSELGSLNGLYSTILSSNGCSFGANSQYSTILGGFGHQINGTGCGVMMGSTNIISNVDYSGAFGSGITINHNACLVINDGGIGITSGAPNSVLIQGANGVVVGKWGNNPTRDVCIGKKVTFTSVSIGVNFNTDALPSIMYFVSTASANVTMTLSNTDKIPGNTFIVKRTSSSNSLIIVPQSGTIDGGANFTMSGALNGGGNKGAIIITDGTNWFTVGAQ